MTSEGVDIDMINIAQLESMRRRGLIERAADGTERVRISLHPRAPAGASNFARLQDLVRAWANDMQAQAGRFGALVLDDTISVSGHSIEALAPIDGLQQLSSAMDARGVEIDLVRPETATF